MKQCIGCKVEIERAPTCEVCWKKLSKSTRVDFLDARKRCAENRSRDLARITAKREALTRVFEKMVYELHPPKAEVTP